MSLKAAGARCCSFSGYTESGVQPRHHSLRKEVISPDSGCLHHEVHLSYAIFDMKKKKLTEEMLIYLLTMARGKF